MRALAIPPVAGLPPAEPSRLDGRPPGVKHRLKVADAGRYDPNDPELDGLPGGKTAITTTVSVYKRNMFFLFLTLKYCSIYLQASLCTLKRNFRSQTQ